MWEHLVSEYTGLNLLEIEQLDWFDYLQYRFDAFVFKMSQTDEGEKYLENAWRLTQDKPEREKLRNKFGKGVNNG